MLTCYMFDCLKAGESGVVIEHRIDQERCDGCGKCAEICNLGLWELVEIEVGRKTARVVDEAGRVCHFCFFCKDICPQNAVTIISEEDNILGRILG